MRGEICREDPHLVDLVGRHMSPELAGAPAAQQRLLRPRRQPVEVAPERTPVHESAPDEPEGVSRSGIGRMRREHESRPRMGRLEHATEAIEDQAQALAPAAQPHRSLVALLGGRRSHSGLDVRDQTFAATGLAVHEQSQGLIQAPPVQIRIEIAQAGRKAPAHLAIGGGVLSPRQPPPAVTKTEQ